MAKKKENQLSYLQMPLPSGKKKYRMSKRNWSGLNYRQTMDTGALSMEQNISTLEAPYLVPSQKWDGILQGYDIPIGIFGIDDILLVIYKVRQVRYSEGSKEWIQDDIRVDYIYYDPDAEQYKKHTGIIGNDEVTVQMDEDEYAEYVEPQRSVVKFNSYIDSADIINGVYYKRLLIFPDKVSMFMHIVPADSDPATWSNEGNTALEKADPKVMYCFGDGDSRKYYMIDIVYETNADGKPEYVRKVKHMGDGQFLCEKMEVTVKEYYNDKPEVDESGAVVFPPPDTANRDCWYKNTAKIFGTSYGTDIYHWTSYEKARLSKDAEIAFTEDKENGEVIGYKVTGFELDESDNYIFDGEMTEGWKVSIPPNVPNIKYATVHLSRLFGVSDDSVYASGFNDYTNWNLDSIGTYDESNAWCSKAQSNTKADGDFTGIINFQGHVVCFKRDFMHEIYSTKNPFRIQDIFAEGAIDQRTIQDVDGRLIFVSADGVKLYTGSNPRDIGYYLNLPKFDKAVSGTDGRCYYLYCEYKDEALETARRMFTYDTISEQWSEQTIAEEVLSFANNKNGMYMLCADGKVYQLNTGSYQHDWSFETDLMTNASVDIKHLSKIQMLAELGKTADFQVYLLYDDEEFEDLDEDEKDKRLVCSAEGPGRKAIRVKPRNTANYGLKLHFEGYGYVKLYEMELIMENGGGLYV